LAPLGDRRLIDRAAAQIAPFCASVVVVGRSDPAWAGVDDRPSPGLGPLGGVAGALDHAQRQGMEAVLTIACDMPLVPESLIFALIEQMPAYCSDAPILGCWPSSLADLLDGHLRQDPKRSIRGWADRIDARAIPAPMALANVNTPADLMAL
jgi:molybdopterin-guanine dinucleotide biosynthesis protein A